MRNTWAQKAYDEIIAAESLSDVENIFNGNKYFTKSEIGAIIGEMIGNFNINTSEKLIIALKSKKYKENIDCVSENNEPLIICLFKAFFNNIKNGNVQAKNKLKSIIVDNSISFIWDGKDSNNNNILHILMENCNLLNDKEFEELLQLLPLHNFNPLNKNNDNKTITQLFNANNRLKTNNKKKKVIEIINTLLEEQIIEINENTYAIEIA